MDIAALLAPYITGLTATQMAQVSTYLDLLLRWNQKTNLTSIRDPEKIVSRHFGESFFLARTLFGPDLSCRLRAERGGGIATPTDTHPAVLQLPITNYKLPILDLGSGAGFPGIPLKIACPDITMTLVEAHHTKAVFLREVLRALELNAEVKNVRAEDLPPGSASLVTLRAVERFDSILPIAARLIQGDREKLIGKNEEEGMDAARPRAASPTPHQNPVSQPAPSPVTRPESTLENSPLVLRPEGTTENSPALQRRVDSGDGSSAVGTADSPRSPVHGLALLISSSQIRQAREILPNWRFRPEIAIPKSQNRVIQLVEPNQ